MAVINRRAIRQAIVNDLRPAMPTAAAVYPYMFSNFKDGPSPVVRLMNAGSNRPPIEEAGNRSTFYFMLQSWVIYFEDGTPEVQEQAEDTLDQLEFEFVTWMAANQVRPADQWTMLLYEGRSTVRTVKVSGFYYVVESIPLGVEVYG